MRTFSLLLALTTACSEPKDSEKESLFEVVDPPDDPVGTDSGDPSNLSARISGPDVDSGFGSTILVEGERVWVAAPHGDKGVVYRVKSDGLSEVVSGQGRVGSSLAMGPSGIWIGAPLRSGGLGSVIDANGDELVGGLGNTGLALAGGNPVIVAHGTGTTESTGALSATTERPTSLARIGSTVAVGTASGTTALQVDGRSLARPSPNDEAGFAMAAGDLDGDGTQEWILGAPSAGMVHIVDADSLSIMYSIQSVDGGFGASLATCDLTGDGRDDLVVGAPSAELTKGAVHLFTSPSEDTSPARTWTGTELGDRLGQAIDCSSRVLAMGAPGGALSNGYIQLVDASAIDG